MRLLLSFLFSLHALILFAQKEVFYAKPVAQMMDSNTSELAYGQKMNIAQKEWLNQEMKMLSVVQTNGNLEVNRDYLLPFAPPTPNMPMAAFAKGVSTVDFKFHTDISGDWIEEKSLMLPADLTLGQSFTVLKSLFERALVDFESMPSSSQTLNNFELGKVYKVDVINQGDYTHAVFSLNSNKGWLQQLSLTKDSDQAVVLSHQRFKISSINQPVKNSKYYVVSNETPFYSSSPINPSQLGTLKTNDELFIHSAEFERSEDGPYYIDVICPDGKQGRVLNFRVLSFPSPIQTGDLKQYVQMLYQLGYEVAYQANEWMQDDEVYKEESITLPTREMSTAVLLVQALYPEVNDRVQVMDNGTILQVDSGIVVSTMESGEILQIGFKGIDDGLVIGLVRSPDGRIMIKTQK